MKKSNKNSRYNTPLTHNMFSKLSQSRKTGKSRLQEIEALLGGKLSPSQRRELMNEAKELLSK